jgi:hypothetical protein
MNAIVELIFFYFSNGIKLNKMFTWRNLKDTVCSPNIVAMKR